jgi:hypothetical protein
MIVSKLMKLDRPPLLGEVSLAAQSVAFGHESFRWVPGSRCAIAHAPRNDEFFCGVFYGRQ